MSCARKPGAVQKKTTWFERQEAYSESELVFRRSRCGHGSSSLPQKDSPTDTVRTSNWWVAASRNPELLGKRADDLRSYCPSH